MEKLKTKYFLTLLGIFAFISISVLIKPIVSGDVLINVFYKAGVIDKEKISRANETNRKVLYAGDEIIVYANDVESKEKYYTLMGISGGNEKAINRILHFEAINHAAKNAGYTASDEEVDKKCKNNRDSFDQATNKEDFLIYLDGLDVTEDEYWENEKTNIRNEIIREKYVSAYRNKLLEGKEVGIDEQGNKLYKDTDISQADQEVDTWLNKIVEEELKLDNVKKID